jgi:hypothetical protein
VTAPPDLSSLDRDLPLLLLPARLEARFADRPASGPGGETTGPDGAPLRVPVLHVRIYPDDISVSRHDPTLTADETRAGAAFWAAHEAAGAGDDPEAERRRLTAWSALAGQVGLQRASVVAAATRGGVQPAPRTGQAAAPTARLLPDRWVVTGWLDGTRAFLAVGKPVPADLPVAPADDAGAADPTRLDPRDPHLVTGTARWLVDLEAARAVGMAVTVDLATAEQVLAGELPPTVGRGVDRLYAFGVRLPSATRTSDTEATELARLLTDHLATDGAAFLAPGTPTNSTAAGPSAWTSGPDPAAGHATVFAPPVLDDGAPLDGRAADGAAAASALGIPAVTVAGFPGAGGSSQRNARLMAETLFPLTWGELFSTLLLPNRVEVDDRALVDGLRSGYAFVREHWAGSVRGRGPLPTLRIGRQPYGLFPVTDVTRWRPVEGEPPQLGRLVDLLGRLQPFWRRAATRVPPLPPADASPLGPDEAGRRLTATLGLGPVPHTGGYVIRPVPGDLTTVVVSATHLPDLVASGGPELPEQVLHTVAHQVATSAYRSVIAQVMGIPLHARLVGMTPGAREPLRIPVARTDPHREAAPHPADYLGKLGLAPWPALGLATPWGDDDPPLDLLYQLAQRSLLLANTQACLALADEWDRVGRGTLIRELRARPPEFGALDIGVGIGLDQALTTPLVELAQQPRLGPDAVPLLSPAVAAASLAEVVSRADLLDTVHQDIGIETPFRRLSRLALDTSAAIDGLARAELSDEEYAWLLGETLALCSSRLDAWRTSVATRRLARQRAARPSGVQLGGFGWLLDLRPDHRPIAPDAVLAGCWAWTRPVPTCRPAGPGIARGPPPRRRWTPGSPGCSAPRPAGGSRCPSPEPPRPSRSPSPIWARCAPSTSWPSRRRWAGRPPSPSAPWRLPGSPPRPPRATRRSRAPRPATRLGSLTASTAGPNSRRWPGSCTSCSPAPARPCPRTSPPPRPSPTPAPPRSWRRHARRRRRSRRSGPGSTQC